MVHTQPHSREEDTVAPLPLQEGENIWHGPSDPQKVLMAASPLGEWQMHLPRPQSTTEGGADSPVHHWGKAPCHPGPLYQAISEEGQKNCQRLQPPKP